MGTTKFSDTDLQSIIGNVLRYGVWTALSVAGLGGIILLFTRSNEEVHFTNFIEKDDNIITVVQNILAGVSQGNGESIIFLGILLLFLTPILRIFLSLLSFFLEKDWLYVFITLIVIGIIVFSVSFGFSH
ncbi:DUF1634 domain-containing protein [Myroides marinus]|jgi:uncharacterized membrane protein|uniref:Uncharacterized membrane protein n=1 Tax=Myroides marinus TaxID=703342 RepID=A0A1H6WTG1_9FLAO|nr:DUF1634 domain-containing protein [Myroides marinus]MDR0195978.1 DUF1634 domain-containing protein [Myroides sp.]KUF42051.1 hypothetical protein AS361_13525 [Myroides marinus]MDM1347818.1 DUF1634 domain-containing protein [Myroides marinus]MDM1351490.1 DUF1634 domain-containing protein [Myroides marinus]MDM1355181.1 DUF1634 domain-containing protein [Myroides marinus]